jgi:rare lipoprotein A
VIGDRTRVETGAIHRKIAYHLSLVTYHSIAAALLATALAGCGSAPTRDASPPARGGGYYLDDGPGANPPADLDSIADAVPRLEPLNRGTSRPYVVMGRSYTPMTALQPYKARGIASWYGRRYHGKPTSSGEIYDMYAMTAAHTTLPIPSYARVTNLATGKSVVVRVNDRGPFIDGRLIDLSYTAAHKLGVLGGGSALVEVEILIPGQTELAAPQPPSAPPAPEPAVVPVAIAPGTAAMSAPASDPPPGPPAVDGQPGAATAGHYLQFGAFGSRTNAEEFLARIRAQTGDLAENLHVYARDGLFRVHAGPYPSQGQARLAADRIGQVLGTRPVLFTR